MPQLILFETVVSIGTCYNLNRQKKVTNVIIGAKWNKGANVIKDLVANVKRVEFYKESVSNVIIGHKCNKGKVTNVSKCNKGHFCKSFVT